MKPNKKTRIGIIGAGAAGLTAAYYLKKQGYENITLLEKEGRTGGKCNSLTYYGKSFDLGANYITSSYTQVKKLAREYGAEMYTEGPLHAFDATTCQLTSLLQAVTKNTSFFTLLWQSIRYSWKRWRLQKFFSAKHVGYKNISQHPQFTQPFKQWLQANGLQKLEPVFSVPITLMGYGNLDEIPAAYALTYMRIGTFINLMMAAINPKILGWPKRFVQGYERLFEKISWEFEVFTNVEIQSIHRKGQLKVAAIVHEQQLNKIVSTHRTFEFDHLIAATPYPLFVELLADATKEEKELAAMIKVNPFVVTTYPVEKADKLFACTFSLPQPAIGEPNVVTRQFAGNDLVSFYTRYNAEQPIPKAQILENNKRFAAKMDLSPLPEDYYTYSDWAYFPHVDAATMQAGFYDRIEALQGQQHIYYTGGLFAFELVEAIACYSQALIKNIFNTAMNIKILVVDDEEDVEQLMQQRFRRKIADGTYQLTFANSGKHALSVIESEPDFDVLLLDINMPEMDGLTLLGKVNKFLSHGRAVIVSAYSDMENIRLAMNRGAFDFICKPINFTDLETTIEKTVRHVREWQQMKQEKELHELKTRFFDNITHEFRTPLTLILSPIDRLLQTLTHDTASRSELLAIDHNARYLLRLINQLLESARLDAGFLQIHEQAGDLTAFIHQLVQAFQPYARQQQVALEFNSDVNGLWLYDEEKLGQVLYNLISNAIKFTGRQPVKDTTNIRGQISVTLQTGTPLRLTITDTGPGIPGSHLPFIFERFYQALPQRDKNLSGTGIGLSLVKEYITLMQGAIQVSSKTGSTHGTTFILELPLQPATTAAIAIAQTATFWDWFPRIDEDQPAREHQPAAAADAALIVLIEDNEELSIYLKEKLSALYRVLTADTAERGWQLIQEELPDVVISDIMLPGMNGYELTNQIKSTAITEHIAVILLTAKSAYDNRLLGLQQGADDYLAKPLHVEELLLRLHNLLTRQQRLRNFYGQQLAQPELPHPMELLHDGWLKELYKVLETHLDDPALNVEWLAAQMAMSRKTLLRKVQSLTKLSPNELIRQYRLRKAADLLRSGYTVAETAYAVGFETPNYFGQCFKELFNVTPGKFVET